MHTEQTEDVKQTQPETNATEEKPTDPAAAAVEKKAHDAIDDVDSKEMDTSPNAAQDAQTKEHAAELQAKLAIVEAEQQKADKEQSDVLEAQK